MVNCLYQFNGISLLSSVYVSGYKNKIGSFHLYTQCSKKGYEISTIDK